MSPAEVFASDYDDRTARTVADIPFYLELAAGRCPPGAARDRKRFPEPEIT